MATIPVAISDLLATKSLPELGPGPRDGVVPEQTVNARLTETLNRVSLGRRRRELLRALMLLWHDHLESAHSIAQEIDDADGAFVHGIVHRREPDYSNATYWFRKVGNHVVFPELATRVRDLLPVEAGSLLLGQLIRQGRWDPFGFIDACENSKTSTSEGRILRHVQQIETQVLVESFLT